MLTGSMLVPNPHGHDNAVCVLLCAVALGPCRLPPRCQVDRWAPPCALLLENVEVSYVCAADVHAAVHGHACGKTQKTPIFDVSLHSSVR